MIGLVVVGVVVVVLGDVDGVMVVVVGRIVDVVGTDKKIKFPFIIYK